MSHLPEALERMSEADPSIVKIKKVPVGAVVVYHGRLGSMRQGRTEFPAFVLKQHPDDGTLDLLVFFEAEDMIWEQRVSPWSQNNPGHSWEAVEKVVEEAPTSDMVYLQGLVDDLNSAVTLMRDQMYGTYHAPEKSMIEYLDDFNKRLSKLEAKLRK